MKKPSIRSRLPIMAAAVTALCLAGAQADAQGSAHPDRDRLIGAWHMVSMEEEGPDGSMTRHTERTGMFVFSADGHFSVQVMYPASEAATAANAAYQRNGYEATFGRFDVYEPNHTITQHVQGALVRTLIGKDLVRVLQFSKDGQLTVRSADAREKWSVTWAHD